MYNSVRSLSREFQEGIEDDSRAKREANQGHWTHTEVTLDKDISEYATGGFGTVESIRPGVVDQIAKLCKN